MIVYDTNNAILFRGVLENLPTVNFTENGVEIHSSDLEILLPLTNYSSIGHISFNQDADPSNIKSLLTSEHHYDGLFFQYTDNAIVTIGGIGSQPVNVLTIGGRQVAAGFTRHDCCVSIDLSPLPQGYYIIIVGNQSFKVFKK